LPVYSGGEITVDRDLSQYHAPMPEFAHCVIGLESCGSKDPQFVASCLLNSLLGGGGSFSAGGPGKGMYSRLYTNVLNRHHWVNSA
uniref:Peptidase_M16_C domain-containing protein n=1 Tax=Hydatigena taeniaeformis TaxID=6205 RepID=A0A0R3WY08_HYDTA